MPSVPITTRLDKVTIEKLEKLSQVTKRSKSFLVAEAVDKYLQEQDWQVEAIKKGLDQAEKDHFAADSEVREFFKMQGVVVED
jgi:RHH-type transcriptional regulator, rel operon repressor / antitoxin RelB